MTFRTALSGLNAASTHLDVTAHNIANVNTAGFKSSRILFSDVYATAANDLSSTSTGSGVQISSISQKFGQGNIDFTNNNLAFNFRPPCHIKCQKMTFILNIKLVNDLPRVCFQDVL